MHYMVLIFSNWLSAYRLWLRKKKRRPFAACLGFIAANMVMGAGLPFVVSLDIEGDFLIVILFSYILLLFASLPFGALAWIAWRDAADEWHKTSSRLK